MLLMVLTINISLDSCGTITIGAAVAQLNAECPKDMGDGITMTKSELVDGNWIITASAPTLETTLVDFMKPAMTDYVKSNAEMSKLLKETNTTLVYRFECSDGTADVKVAPSDL